MLHGASGFRAESLGVFEVIQGFKGKRDTIQKALGGSIFCGFGSTFPAGFAQCRTRNPILDLGLVSGFGTGSRLRVPANLSTVCIGLWQW